MECTQNSRTMQSAMFNNALPTMASNPKSISRRTSDLSFCTVYEQAEQVVQKPIPTLDAALELENV